MARKFNIGDTVEVVPGACDDDDAFKVGHRGKITEYDGFGAEFPYTVKRRNGNTFVFTARELKLIKRKTNQKGNKNGTN